MLSLHCMKDPFEHSSALKSCATCHSFSSRNARLRGMIGLFFEASPGSFHHSRVLPRLRRGQSGVRKVAPTHRHFKDCNFDFSRQRSFWRGTRVRSCGACGGSWLLPKIGMMFAVDCFCRTVACMQGGLQLCAAVA